MLHQQCACCLEMISHSCLQAPAWLLRRSGVALIFRVAEVAACYLTVYLIMRRGWFHATIVLVFESGCISISTANSVPAQHTTVSCEAFISA